MLPEITSKVGVPRALEVPWPLGFPLGAPHDTALQREVLVQLLGLTDRSEAPVMATFARGRAD